MATGLHGSARIAAAAAVADHRPRATSATFLPCPSSTSGCRARAFDRYVQADIAVAEGARDLLTCSAGRVRLATRKPTRGYSSP
jgi:hypothetical protein